MELILYPIFIVFHIVAELIGTPAIHAAGLLLNRKFGSFEDLGGQKRLSNRWQVFWLSMLGVALLALFVAAISFCVWRTWTSIYMPFLIVGSLGIAASLSAISAHSQN